MDGDRFHTTRIIPKRLVIALLYILILSLSSTSSLEDSIEVELQPMVIGRDDRFTLIMKAPFSDSENIDIQEPLFPESVRLVSGPNIRNLLEEGDSDIRRRFLEISYTFSAVNSGRRGFGSFTIESPELKVSSKPFILEIGIKSDRDIIPFDVSWRAEENELFEGQTVTVVLSMDNVTEIVFPEEFSYSSPKDAVFEEVEGLGEIRAEAYGEMELYSVPVASFLFTPTSVGTITIPDAQVESQGLVEKAKPLTFSVKPVPEQVRNTGAVGNFFYNAKLSQEEVSVGETVLLYQRVEGTGNLNYLEIPEVTADALLILATNETNVMVPMQDGYSGFREIEYRFIPEEAGRFSIEVPDFVWLGPNSGKLFRIRGSTYSINVKNQAENADQEDGPPLLPFAPKNYQEVTKLGSFAFYKNSRIYLWLLPGPLFVVFYLVWRNRKDIKRFFSTLLIFLIIAVSAGSYEEHVNQGLAAYSEGNYETALREFNRALKEAPGNSGLYFNSALSHFALKEVGESIHAMMMAIKSRPMHSEYRDALSYLESTLGLERQINPPYPLHPDLFLLIFLVMSNVLSVFIVSFIRKRHALYAILIIISCLIVAVSGVGIVWTKSVLQNPTGVIGPSIGQLRKIPRIDATEWLSLEEGTSVHVVMKSGEYYLVRTAYEIEGWIHESAILIE